MTVFDVMSSSNGNVVMDLTGKIMFDRPGANGRAQFYVFAGFGDSSPDFGGGLSLGTSF